MEKNLAPKYDHKVVEEGRYSKWVKEGYFTAGDLSKEPFTIVIPPPNVTGKLHIGHALDGTLEDILARYKKTKGYDVLFLPGMDHAGIATQAKVDERLRNQGISRYDIGREKFLEQAWAWKEEYASTIRKQWEKLGLALDYSRERFTMDEGFNQAVNHVFVSLYEEGLIYRGYRIINWDPEAKTALSNIEVYYQEDPGKMYYFDYLVEETGEHFVVATTRPETMFGDVCVVINPNDEKLKHLIGKHAINPANHEVLPIIGDDYVEIGFGTGAMKCTPAHDPNDYQIALRHDLKMPIVMNPDGTMNQLCGKYEGLDRYVARDQLVEQIKAEGNLVKIEEITHSVAHSERTHCVVEPYLSEQWFVKMKPLADEVLKNQEIDEETIHFYPERFDKTFRQWLENIEDWCISRQLWWGHRIPAYYHKKTGEMIVSKEPPANIEDYIQDEDVLDTWFSSALWPFGTMDWPTLSDDLKRYYPTDTLVTGYDIIFFWVARMAFQARYFTHHRPFKDVLIHGLVRDAQGRKMSKSLGNGIDPMDVIDTYGVDALRYFLSTSSAPGQDMRYIPEKVEASWNFINKIWNASRFVMMNLDETADGQFEREDLSLVDTWILHRLNEVIDSVTTNMDKYEFAIAGNELYGFVWDDFCSWYLEMSKSNLNGTIKQQQATKHTLYVCLRSILVMLYPFMPFVTDEIYQTLPNVEQSICQAQWPTPIADLPACDMEAMQRMLGAITKIREVKNVHNLKPSAPIDVMLKDLDGHILQPSPILLAIIQKMAKANWVEQLDGDITMEAIPYGTLHLPSNQLSNPEEEKAKLQQELQRLSQEINRSTTMLNNPGFVNKAPAAKVEQERVKLDGYQKQYDAIAKRLEQLG